MKKIFIILTLTALFISCDKGNKTEETKKTDIRDKYVGTYDYKMTGTIYASYAGEIIATIPLNETGTDNISKSGETELIVMSLNMTLSGTKLLPITMPFTNNENGVSMVGSIIHSGNVSNNLITITSEYSGTVTTSGISGTVNGSTTTILTKR